MRDVHDAMTRVYAGSCTQNDIAKEWGVTPGRVSQIFKKASTSVTVPPATTLGLFATPAPKLVPVAEYDQNGYIHVSTSTS